MTTDSRQGRLIVFEGTDGCGKSTQLQLLHDELVHRGVPVVATREPTNGRFGQKIRQLYNNREEYEPNEELELFLADRQEHVQEVINPALTAGKIVICDRYYLSTAAYQGARGYDPLDIIARNGFAPQPDLALIFQLPLSLGLARIVHGRGEKLNDFENLQNLERVAAIFSSLQFPYIHRIDASGSIHEVQQQVMSQVLAVLPATYLLSAKNTV
jgi:dTMP kinase